MLLFNQALRSMDFPARAVALMLFAILSACQFQPLYGDRTSTLQNGTSLSGVSVSQVDTRVGQQVRNHLLFLLDGGFTNTEKTHEARIRVNSNNKKFASVQDEQDSTSGSVTVIVTYDLVDLATGKAIANGSRQAFASYDRTGQVFANERAVRDAENRAAKETAESLRLAITSDLSRI